MNKLFLEASNTPQTVVPGERTTITVIVRDERRNPVSQARVTIAAGGGVFLPEPNTPIPPVSHPHGDPVPATGLTDHEGRFQTGWVELVNPGAPGYEMDIEATKAGFTSGKAGLLIKVK